MVDAPARAPRSAPRLIGETFQLYGSYPLLFLILAAGVIVPYRLIVLAALGAGPFTGGGLSFGVSMLLSLTDWVLVDPLVSALHVHAVAEVEEGRTPRLGPVARRGLVVLPLVASAAIMSGLAFFGGLLLFVLPGAYIWIRLTVTAQTAAIERQGWMPALRRSWGLTEGRFFHVFLFVICVSAITLLPGFLIDRVLTDETTVGSFLIGLAIQVLVISFTALATAVLYFDLRARRRIEATARDREPTQTKAAGDPPIGTLDPRHYSDEDRPPGWYVDPARPRDMRYWAAGDPPSWQRGKARTPRKLRKQWNSGAQHSE
jgi:hypothetical protein